MSSYLFTNVMVLDGKDNKSYIGEVLVEDDRITAVASGNGKIDSPGAQVLDGAGATLMPGLINCHSHLTFPNAETPADIGLIPPEEHTLMTMHNARTVLDYGFTSVISAASAKPRLDVVIRNEIEAGRIPGPRMLAGSPEITTTGGLGDERRMHIFQESFGLVADGPEEIRKICRTMIREGVDLIKINNSGDNGTGPHALSCMTTMDDDEVEMACRVAASRNKRVAAHARSAESVKQCIRFGVDLIYHATLCDDEALDMLEANKSHVHVIPALAPVIAGTELAAMPDQPPEIINLAGLFEKELASACENLQELHKRGVHVLPFGDYGFSFTPHGTDARDLEYFQNLLHFTPDEIIRATTHYGALAFGAGDEIGQVKKGFIADLLLIKGDPLQDLTLFQNTDNILMVMKAGKYHSLNLTD